MHALQGMQQHGVQIYAGQLLLGSVLSYTRHAEQIQGMQNGY
jgi:hypothetical protein